MAAFLAQDTGVGDQTVDLAHACADAISRRSGCARKELTRPVELDRAGDLSPDEAIQIEIHCAAGAEVQGIGGLENEFVVEQAVDALAARQANRLQRRTAQNQRNGAAADFERARLRSTECVHVMFLPEAAPVRQESSGGLWEGCNDSRRRKRSGNHPGKHTVTDCTHARRNGPGTSCVPAGRTDPQRRL